MKFIVTAVSTQTMITAQFEFATEQAALKIQDEFEKRGCVSWTIRMLEDGEEDPDTYVSGAS